METSSTLGQPQEVQEVNGNVNQNALAVSDSSPALSEKTEVKALLAEARATREMLVSFASAIESGTFVGVQMINVAKGCAFLDAILRQNNAHIHNLQQRLEGK